MYPNPEPKRIDMTSIFGPWELAANAALIPSLVTM
jgi:hypothetical protein